MSRSGSATLGRAAPKRPAGASAGPLLGRGAAVVSQLLLAVILDANSCSRRRRPVMGFRAASFAQELESETPLVLV